ECPEKEVIIRPNRLGLGAEPKMIKSGENKSSRKNQNHFRLATENHSLIVPGAFFVIKDSKDPLSGFYGKILHFDDSDKNILICKLAIKKNPIKVSSHSVRIVDSEEYSRFSHYI
ncbi:MAG: hypothetical protein MHPSP_004223, partial [Paramarteilia canceri]